ncbi:hypothetical protein FGO68_gene6623 [Halteria grandinella]|uniref:Uncharacterized protein n=1 Tax=Halteria grandinella TaxID=5974 RepID=A0A8J8NWK2_HALGN|nr:hypothetical protein FGO68_gene6623 [Halteria grandinella]
MIAESEKGRRGGHQQDPHQQLVFNYNWGPAQRYPGLNLGKLKTSNSILKIPLNLSEPRVSPTVHFLFIFIIK